MAEAAKGAAQDSKTDATPKTGAAAETPKTDQGKTADDKGAAPPPTDAGAGKTDDKEPKGKETPPPAAPKAPEKYDLTVPDEHKGRITAADLKWVEKVARANDWTQEDAQAELEEQIARMDASVKETAAEYLKQLKADSDYGGEHFAETQKLQQRAIDRIRPEGHAHREGFLAMLSRPEIRDNPYVAAFMADVGRFLSEDAPPRARSSSGRVESDAASSFYDHPTSKALESKT